MRFGETLRRTWMAVAAACFAAGAASAQNYQFELIAGGALGDGGPATQAFVSGATDLVYDANGNLYVSQATHNRIRKIAPNGTITTVVGGTWGFGGDDGPASAAKIATPRGLAIDKAGNLYFSDYNNARIRRISPNGTITTVVGNGVRDSLGDGGQARQASIESPEGLAFDEAGNLYIAQAFDYGTVRKVAPNGVITTVAGSYNTEGTGDGIPATSAYLDTPSGLDTDAAGNVYIATFDGVRRLAPNGMLHHASQIAGLTVEVTANGALYQDDFGACTLVRISGGTATTIAGIGFPCKHSGDGGPATSAGIGLVEGIAIDAAGNVVFGESDAGQVRKITGGTISTIAGTGAAFVDGRAALGAPLERNSGISVDANGNIAISEGPETSRVVGIDAAGSLRTLYKNEEVWYPYAVAHGAGGTVYFSDRYQAAYRLEANGTRTMLAPRAYGIATDAAGNLYVANGGELTVSKVDPAGVVTTFAGDGTMGNVDSGPATSASVYVEQLATDAAGNVYLSDRACLIRKVDTNGIIATIAGRSCASGLPVAADGMPALGNHLGGNGALAVDDSGVYFVSGGGIRRIAPDGTLDTLQGLPSAARALAIRDGQLYVTGMDGRVWRATLANPLPSPTAAHDYDGDGRSDILWRNSQTGADVVWRGAAFSAQLPMTGVTGTAWKIVGQGDFDGDGHDDVVWRNASTGANRIWRSANSTQQIAIPNVALAWSIAGVGDFDKDGKSDLVWRNASTGQTSIWSSGDIAKARLLPSLPAQWRLAGVADFDGDGASDLLWRNTANGQNGVWRSGNSALPLAVSSVTALAFKVAGVGDFDGNGRADILWRNTTTGQNIVWNDAKLASNRPLVAVTDQRWKVVAVGDYDGDSKSDLLWRHAGNGANVIWKSADAAKQHEVTDVTNLPWDVMPYEFQP